jgi:hypothetical protein
MEAQQQTAVAEAAVDEAELATIISRSSVFVQEDTTLSILLALEANRRAPGPITEQVVLNALGSSTAANRVVSYPADLTPPASAHSSSGERMG